MSKHTPGPWRYELDGHESNDMRHAVLSEENDLWVAATYRSGTTANKDTSSEADAEAAANARLIAAAPDLLEALRECADRLAIHMKHSEDLVAHMQAHKAIAKATGEHP